MNSEIEEIGKCRNYLSPSRYISGRIIEYDIEKANISILYSRGLISKEMYELLKRSPKYNREVIIGNAMRGNKLLPDTIAQVEQEAILFLLNKNNIQARQIARIANDAIYINTSKDLQYLALDDYVHFRVKSISNVMMQINKHTLVFVTFMDNGNIDINIKGINAEKVSMHQDYLCTEIAKMIFIKERVSTQDAIVYLNEFIEKYIKLELPIEYYREFNSSCGYKLKREGFYILNTDDKYSLDISYNLNILRSIFQIFLMDYNPK